MTKSGILKSISICILVTGLYLPRTVMAPLPPPIEYFVDDTGSGTACTQAFPCLLSEVLLKAAPMNIYLATGTYTGSGEEVVKITTTKIINLYGGWDGATTGPIIRDPATYISIIDGENARRGISIVGNGVDPLLPVITGLSIINGNANGVISPYCDGVLGAGNGCGGGIYSYYAAPQILANKIYNNTAAKVSAGSHGYGGGIYLYKSNGAQVLENEIYQNKANPDEQGAGGGIYASYGDATTNINNNNIYSNTSSGLGLGWGDGIAIELTTGLHINQNTIHDNGASGRAVHGSAIYIFFGAVSIENNLVIDNYEGYTVYFEQSTGGFARNRIWHNEGYGGLLVSYGGTGFSCPVSNYLDVTNNFIAANGNDQLLIYGISASPACVNVTHNTIDNGQYGIDLDNTFTVNIINNIISNQTSYGIINASSVSTPVVDHNLYYNNSSGNSLGFTGTNDLEGDPKYISQVIGDYHIWCNSPARDAGNAGVGITVDIDGQTRPIGSGFEIGADECTPLFYLPLIIRN